MTQTTGSPTRAKAYKLTDAHQLYLFVTPKGSKLWRWITDSTGSESVPQWPYPLVSLIEVREKRDDARRLLANGNDPSVVKKLRIQENIESARMTFPTRCSRMARSEQTAVGQGSCCRSDQNARAGCLSPGMVGGPVAAADLIDTVAWLNPRPPANPMRFTPAGGQARPGTHAACSSGI